MAHQRKADFTLRYSIKTSNNSDYAAAVVALLVFVFKKHFSNGVNKGISRSYIRINDNIVTQANRKQRCTIAMYPRLVNDFLIRCQTKCM